MYNVLINKKEFWDPYFFSVFPGYSSILQPLQSLQLNQRKLCNWPTIEDFNVCFKGLYKFVWQTKDMRYEWEIFKNYQIPTREGLWHDFFNNLTWISFPEIKRALIEKMFVLGFEIKKRTHQQNLIAHFDEVGMILCTDNAFIFDMIQNHEWKKLFIDFKSALNQCYPLIIGHGLMEKALTPFLGLTAKAIFLQVGPRFFNLSEQEKQKYIDIEIAQYIKSDKFPTFPKALHPFPILGWPTWYKNNEVETFFDNLDYFRPKRNIHERFVESARVEGRSL